MAAKRHFSYRYLSHLGLRHVSAASLAAHTSSRLNERHAPTQSQSRNPTTPRRCPAHVAMLTFA
eukprot:7389933-Prymnesium_polylepis.1